MSCAWPRTFGDALANPLDDLTDVAEQDAQGAVQNPEYRFQAPLGVEHMRGFPEFLQNMQQIQDQGDAELPFDQNLQSSLAVADGHVSLAALRIAALHLLGHLLHDGGLAFEQAGPYALVLQTRGSLSGGGRLTFRYGTGSPQPVLGCGPKARG